MRQILSRSLLTVAAASSVLAAVGGYASADSSAEGNAAGSPGALSGNSVQVPVDVPVNACGDTVDAVGAVNPAFGNKCATTSAYATRSGASGTSDATGSPGLLSGNTVDVPVHVPVNACGDSVDPVGILNPAFGNSCANGSAAAVGSTSQDPTGAGSTRSGAAPQQGQVTPATSHHDLAETGFSSSDVGAAGATSAALLLGGAMLYRRGTRAAARVR